jgi:IS30 family transposase
VGQKLNAKTYFCHAYHSWEKGTNENTNGLVRRYLPRGKNIDDLTQVDIDEIAEELNNRPRKKLGYFTPNEMLKSEYYSLSSCD